MRPVDIFHIGPQKTATTWLYCNLRQHPQIIAPNSDRTHFFDIHYGAGMGALHAHYPDQVFEGGSDSARKILDPTYSYSRSLMALRRIHAHNPAAKIAINLRHPVERAWSHYWHEFKKGKISFSFEECLENYDLFQNWIEAGLPLEAIEYSQRQFGRDRVKIILYDDIQRDPDVVLRDLFRFYEVDPDFQSEHSQSIINPAGHKRNLLTRVMTDTARGVGLDQSAPALYARLSGLEHYRAGINPDLHSRVMALIRPAINVLEDLSGFDLSIWR